MRKKDYKCCAETVIQGKQQMNVTAEKLQDDQDIDDAAGELFDLFEHYSVYKNEVNLVSEEGLFEMSMFFGTVPEDIRGYVFLSFLSMLYDADYRYDMQQFLQMDEVGSE